jgi:tRNA modification GTPase
MVSAVFICFGAIDQKARMHPSDQTIFALSSGKPPTAIALVRLSGRAAGDVLLALTGRMPTPRHATRAMLRDAAQQIIDDAVVLWFPGPASATGEDLAELHIHGSRAVLASLVETLQAFANVRAAESGEFTRRAFENGKIDLTEAEGLNDLIHADTEQQRRQALRQLKGLLGERARDWRQQILDAQAFIEAGIDFSDEGDVPAELMAPARERIAHLKSQISSVLDASTRSERLREGLVVAIIGPPNVGKSTLMNQLARREIAIVSPHAGTTRDIIELHLDLDGYPVTVIDTAGLRETNDPIEQEGVRRAEARAAEADLRLWLVDAQADEPVVDIPLLTRDLASDAATWVIRNKVDDLSPNDLTPDSVAISAKSGLGVQELTQAIARFAAAFFDADHAVITRARHRTLLQQTVSHLEDALQSGEQEIVAEHLRAAAQDLGRLVGRVDVEDVLGTIFSSFCIGK